MLDYNCNALRKYRVRGDKRETTESSRTTVLTFVLYVYVYKTTERPNTIYVRKYTSTTKQYTLWAIIDTPPRPRVLKENTPPRTKVE